MTKVNHVETFGELAHLVLDDGKIVCFKIEGVYKPVPTKETLVINANNLDLSDVYIDGKIKGTAVSLLFEAILANKRVVIE